MHIGQNTLHVDKIDNPIVRRNHLLVNYSLLNTV